MSDFEIPALTYGRIIFDDLYGRGHGEKSTIERFQSVMGIDKETAKKLFDEFVADDAKFVK